MAVISKILTSTLVAGTTYVSFTDSDIPNSLIRVFADDPDLMYQTVSLTGNTLTLTYEAQTSNKSIALDIVKQGLEVIDALDSTDVSKALSANQGRILKTYIDNLPTPVYELSDLDDVEITEISDGQVLAWDDVLQKFVNVDQSSGGSGVIYSNEEQLIGKWYDGSDLYARTFEYTNSGISAGTTALVTLDSDVNVKRVFGMVHHVSTDRSYTLPYIGSSGATSLYISDDNKITMILTSGTWSNSYTPIYLYIEYTKEVTP